MSIDLLHRINASERRFRRGRRIIGEFVVDEAPDDEAAMEIRKVGGPRRSNYGDAGDTFVTYYARDFYGDKRPVYILAGDLIDQFKEP